jgi:hypothetical protein
MKINLNPRISWRRSVGFGGAKVTRSVSKAEQL